MSIKEYTILFYFFFISQPKHMLTCRYWSLINDLTNKAMNVFLNSKLVKSLIAVINTKLTIIHQELDMLQGCEF